MNRHIRPVVRALAIDKRVGWHSFRHTYSTLLKSVGADLKVMQELLRHASIRVTTTPKPSQRPSRRRKARLSRCFFRSRRSEKSVVSQLRHYRKIRIKPFLIYIHVEFCDLVSFGKRSLLRNGSDAQQ
jgi:Phage integrase family